MGLLQDKFAKYDLPQQFMAKGVYPYFRTINSHQDTEVMMDGKKVLMFGSNAYMGLTYDCLLYTSPNNYYMEYFKKHYIK